MDEDGKDISSVPLWAVYATFVRFLDYFLYGLEALAFVIE
jgi:hypothetical protein